MENIASLNELKPILDSLIAKGLVKARNYRNSKNKAAYLYLLTPKGVAEKGRMAREFLAVRMVEYDRLARELLRIEGDLHPFMTHLQYFKDVLALPYGFEIYSLLTRWNPLNVRRPHALAYNGRNWLNEVGDVVSHAARVVERFTLTTPDRITYEATVTLEAANDLQAYGWAISIKSV